MQFALTALAQRHTHARTSTHVALPWPAPPAQFTDLGASLAAKERAITDTRSAACEELPRALAAYGASLEQAGAVVHGLVGASARLQALLASHVVGPTLPPEATGGSGPADSRGVAAGEGSSETAAGASAVARPPRGSSGGGSSQRAPQQPPAQELPFPPLLR